MKNGYARFEHYLLRLETLLQQASNDKNPALWLYTNDARTPLFMLEGLAKLYAGLHNENRFTKLKEDFKLLEDAIGAIDYYDCFAKEFLKNEHIPVTVTDYVQGQSREKIQRLNELLQERSWIGEGSTRIQKMRKKLAGADWMKDEKETNAIKDFYKNAIEDIEDFETKLSFRFTELESQVHELRRRLRWLSIYPQALQGLIQLTQTEAADEGLQKYLTPEIVNSSFNKMPPPGINQFILVFEKNYFLSLSWMIAAFGKIKDNGLRIMVISEALQQVHGIDKDAAISNAYQITGDTQPGLTDLLVQASQLADAYYKEGFLQKLIIGLQER